MTLSQITSNAFDVIIIGASFSGLSAALTLSRSMRSTLLIDAGKPCNWMVKHAHNFFGHDGDNPGQLLANARKQLFNNYETAKLVQEKAVTLEGSIGKFTVGTESGARYEGKRIIFASGVRDIMPQIPGFEKAWGRGIAHCPFCHGHEVKHLKTAAIGNGIIGSMMIKMVRHWAPEATLLTNGTCNIDDIELLKSKGIRVVETEIASLDVSEEGNVSKVNFVDGTSEQFEFIYCRPEYEQSCDLISQIGCKLNDNGLIQVDGHQKTSVPGVYACGDNQTPMRALAVAVNSGMLTGAMMTHDMVFENYV